MKKILSIDGGGIRGIIPAIILAHLEEKTGKRIASMFDMVVGTSVGGILAMALTRHDGHLNPRYTAKELIEIFEKRGQDIFSRSLWKKVVSVGGFNDERYPHDGLESVLDTYLADSILGDSLIPVMVPAYEIEKRNTLFMKSWKQEHKNLPMHHVGRAASAAPTFFEPAKMRIGQDTVALIDGGIFINSPVVSAYAEAKKFFGNEEELLVVSLGTGVLNRKIPYDDAKDWGATSWMMPLLNCTFDGVADAADYQMKLLLSGDRYYRYQIELKDASDDMDNATNGNIANLKVNAGRIIASNQRSIEKLISIL